MSDRPRGFIFDLDGCLVRGPQPIAGAPEAVSEIKRRGLLVRYFTNDSSKTQAQMADRLGKAGIPAEPEEVLTSAVVAARYVQARFPGGRALPVGAPALLEALEQQGLTLTWDASADVVVVGRDPEFDYRKLEAACRAIWRGAAFLATNLDRRVPVEDGFVPGTGSMVKAVSWATARAPRVMGKPSVWAGRAAVESLGLPAGAAAVVGDQILQDIRMGKLAGAGTILVLSGSSTEADVERTPLRYRPEVILADVGRLVEWLDNGASPAPKSVS
ncbi:MAG: HAD-IIA family hydrolase [Chloroflexota bacterium]|nr:HAD-IIA family hydrolase [Chloroflexota bacterium]